MVTLGKLQVYYNSQLRLQDHGHLRGSFIRNYGMKTLAIATVCLILACGKNASSSMTSLNTTTQTTLDTMVKKLTYLALGDSYTIGEAVEQQLSFPYQLADKLRSSGLNITTPKIIAKTGWTTDELQAAIVEAKITDTYDFVTLLIGVNNQYRGYSEQVYRNEFKELLLTAIGFAGGDKTHVFVVSIPDWGATPFGKDSGKDQDGIDREIDQFNAINKQETLAAGVSYTDITPGSKLASSNVALVASDGLHPSGKMYADWASALLPSIERTFK